MIRFADVRVPQLPEVGSEVYVRTQSGVELGTVTAVSHRRSKVALGGGPDNPRWYNWKEHGPKQADLHREYELGEDGFD